MLQDLTKQVSLEEENSSVRLFLWSGPWGQDPWGQSHGITVSHVRKTQPGGDFCHKRGGAQENGGVGASLSLHDVPPLFWLTPWDGLGGAWEGAYHPGQLFPAGLGLQPRGCPTSLCSCLENFRVRGAWQLTVYGVAKNRT